MMMSTHNPQNLLNDDINYFPISVELFSTNQLALHLHLLVRMHSSTRHPLTPPDASQLVANGRFIITIDILVDGYTVMNDSQCTRWLRQQTQKTGKKDVTAATSAAYDAANQ